MITLFATALVAASPCASPWPLLHAYVQRFVSEDGRVIDRTAADRTTSEGQAYGLFFSLVANDRALFERLLGWTERNLARGDLSRNLPAWHWGKRKDGSWGVVDGNSASDADLWLAYDLLEAGRLWSEPRYAQLGRRILDVMKDREVAPVPGFGPALLPGPEGFALGGGFRVNPSYAPPQLLRRFAAFGPPWLEVRDSSLGMLKLFAVGGAAPDWALASRGRLSADPVTGTVGSYDAVRVYLWLGMMPDRDESLDGIGSGLLRAIESTGHLPEKIDARSLRTQGEAPPGFYAALLPFAPARLRPTLERRLQQSRRGELYGSPPAYYDQNLILFAQGFLESRYRFTSDGSLAPAWGEQCLGRAR